MPARPSTIFLFAGAVMLTAAPAAQAVASIAVAVTGADRAWIVALPSRLADSAVTYHAAGSTPVDVQVPDAAPLLLCAGANARATQCEQILPSEEQSHRFDLSEGRRVEGRCLVGRKPAAGATLELRPEGVALRRPVAIPLALEGRHWQTSVRTGSDGRFVIEHLAPGRYVFEVTTASGRTDESDAVTVPPLEPPREGQPLPSRNYRLDDIRLAEGIGVAVEVRSSDGLAIPDARVELIQHDAAGRVRVIGGTADARGMTELDGPDPNAGARVSCAAKGFSRGTQEFDVLPPLITCTLDRLGEMKGAAADRHRQPVAGAVVELVGRGRRTSTGDAGTFAFDDVAAGTYELRVSSSATGMAMRTIELGAGEMKDVGTIVLQDAAPLSARVIDADTGNPVAGASVSAVEPPHGGHTVTGEDGTFVLAGDADAPTRVRVTSVGYAPAYAALHATPEGRPSDNAAIRLVRPGSIEVQAWDDDTGEPCRGCTVNVSNADAIHAQITNADGIARQDGLAPGEYQVLRERVSTTSKLVTVSGGDDTRMATVRPGETVRVELGSRSRRTRISLSPPPAPGWELKARSGARFVLPTPLDATGMFSFRRDPRETYELRLETAQAGVVVGVVPATSTQELVSITIPGGVLEIHLAGPGGPAVGVLLNVLDAGGATAGWAVTNGDGLAQLRYLRAGSYTVVAAGGRTTVGVVNVTEGSAGVLRAKID